MTDELKGAIAQFIAHLSSPTVTQEKVKKYCLENGIKFDGKKYYPKGTLTTDEKLITELATILAKNYIDYEDEKPKKDKETEVASVNKEEEEEDVFDSSIKESEAEQKKEKNVVQKEEIEPKKAFSYVGTALKKKDLSEGVQGLMHINDISFRHNIRGQIIEDEDFIDLIEDIKEQGVTQPVSVDEKGALLAGYRRVEASKRANFTVIPVYCQSGTHAFDIQTSENLNRQNLCALDFCLAIKYSEEVEGWDRDKISKKFKQHKTVLARILKHIGNIPQDLYPVLRSEKSDIALMALIELAEIGEEDLIRSLLDREGALKLKDIRALVASLKEETEEDFDDADNEDDENEDSSPQKDRVPKESLQDTYWEKASEFLSYTRDFIEYVKDSGAKVNKALVSDLIKELDSLL